MQNEHSACNLFTREGGDEERHAWTHNSPMWTSCTKHFKKQKTKKIHNFNELSTHPQIVRLTIMQHTSSHHTSLSCMPMKSQAGCIIYILIFICGLFLQFSPPLNDSYFCKTAVSSFTCSLPGSVMYVVCVPKPIRSLHLIAVSASATGT